MADSRDSAVVDVLIELKQSGLDAARDINEQLKDLNSTVKDVNQSLERMSDRAHADALALLEVAGAATVARGATTGGGVMGFVSSLAQLMPGGTVLGYAILGMIGLALAFAPFLPVLAGAIVLMTAFLVAVATLATVAAIGFGGIAALATGIVLLGNRTAVGHAALQELGTDLTAMADVLSARATPMMIQMVQWMDRFIPQIQKAGTDLISWFGQRLPALFPIMTNVVNVLAGAFGQILGAIGKVVDYVISHPQFLAFFDSLVKVGAAGVVGLLTNLLRLSDWFLVRLPAISAIVIPIFQGIGNVIQGIGHVAGVVVDWFIAHWSALTKAAGDAWAGLKQGWDAAWPGLQSGFELMGGLLNDVVNHLRDLKPLLPATGFAFAAMVGVMSAQMSTLLLLVDALERIVAAGTWVVAHWGQLQGAGGGSLPGAGGRYGGHGAGGLPGAQGPTGGPITGSGGGSAPAGKPMSANTGGNTVLPIAFVTLPPSPQQVAVMNDALRRLNQSLQPRPN